MLCYNSVFCLEEKNIYLEESRFGEILYKDVVASIILLLDSCSKMHSGPGFSTPIGLVFVYLKIHV